MKSLHNVSYVFTGSLIGGVSLFALNIVLSRALDKNVFGMFALSVLVISTVSEMSDLGLNGGLLRFGPYYIKNNQPEKLKQLVKTIWTWRVWLSVVLTVGGIVLSPLLARYVFNRPEIQTYIVLSFIGIGGVIMLGFVATFLQAQERFRYNATLQALKGFLRLFIVTVMYLVGVKSLVAYILVYIAIPWLLFIFSYGVLPEKFKKVQIEDEVKEKMNSELAKFSFWLTIWSLSAVLSSRVDQIMLSHLSGLDKVAIYSVSFQFIYFYALATQAVSSVLMPKMNALKTNLEIVDFIKRSSRWILSVAVLATLFIYPSKFIISLAFGAKYLEAIPIYLILSYSMIIGFIGIPFSLVITAFNKTQLVAYSGFAQLIINFALNLLLIPKFGAIGAGITFALGVLFSFIYNLACSLYLLRFKQITIT